MELALNIFRSVVFIYLFIYFDDLDTLDLELEIKLKAITSPAYMMRKSRAAKCRCFSIDSISSFVLETRGFVCPAS